MKYKWKVLWDSILYLSKWLRWIHKWHSCWRGCGAKGTLLHCWWEYRLVQSLWKYENWVSPQKIGNQSTSRPNYTTLGHIHKGHLLNHVHCSFIHNFQKLETTKTSLNQRIAKENVVHLNNGVLLSERKSINLRTTRTSSKTKLSYKEIYLPQRTGVRDKDSR